MFHLKYASGLALRGELKLAPYVQWTRGRATLVANAFLNTFLDAAEWTQSFAGYSCLHLSAAPREEMGLHRLT